MTKIITLFSFFISMWAPMLALSETVDLVEYNGETTQKWVDELTDIIFSSDNRIFEKRENLALLKRNLQMRVKLDDTNPALHFLLGRTMHGILSMRVDEIRHLGREKALQDSQYVQFKRAVTENYQKALALDDKGYLIQLSGKMLGIIDASIFSNGDMRVKALRKELDRPWGEGESYEYNTYSNIVTAYMDEKRYDEALSVINEIAERFPSMQSEVDAGRQRIQHYQQAAITKPEPEKNTAVVDKPVTPTSQTTVAQVKPEKQILIPNVEQPTSESTENNGWLWLIGLVVIILAGVMMKRRRL